MVSDACWSTPRDVIGLVLQNTQQKQLGKGLLWLTVQVQQSTMVGQLCQWNLTQLATLSPVSKQEWWVWCSVYRLLLSAESQSMKYCPPHFEWDIIPQLIPSENCRHARRDCDMTESSHRWSTLFLCWRSPGWDTSVIYRCKTAWCGLCEECRLLGTRSPTISKPWTLQLCKCRV